MMPAVTPRLACRDIRVAFGSAEILRDVSLTVAPGEIVAVLGQSGCGKSTLLRAIAGLHPPDSGEIAIDGAIVDGRGMHIPPERRHVGMMFQDVALFPHLSVLANVAFGLQGRAGRKALTVARTRLRELGLDKHETAWPATLSGGQAQRAALARALAPEPRVLLLDEPFSSLDARTRATVQGEVLAVLRGAAMSAIIVTHDRDEAIFFADRIALMRHGVIEQTGSAEDLYRRPRSPAVARALGDVVEIEGVVRQGVADTPLGVFVSQETIPDGPVIVLLRPEAFTIDAASNGITANVLRRTFAGPGINVDLAVQCLNTPLRLRVAADQDHGSDTLQLVMDRRGAMMFPRTTALQANSRMSL